MMELIEELAATQSLGRSELVRLLENHQNMDLAERLAGLSWSRRRDIFGQDVYLRGLIEFTNYCRNDCFYCGLRKSNPQVARYRLTEEEILECCQKGWSLGLRTFVLQGGEDEGIGDDELVALVGKIKARYPDCALTLSAGEKSSGAYEALFAAGADRYLLRHETATASHYARLHPPALSLEKRRECLFKLKEIGFQTGAGFMVGLPWQTMDHLATDLLFLKELSPQMVGIGPFIPHPETPLKGFPTGSVDLTAFLVGLTRLLLPQALLPATTALATLEPQGREKALAFGANVVMPNLSPLGVREKYEIYQGKAYLDEEAAEGLSRLKTQLAALGYQTPESRGDWPGQG